MTLVSFSGMHAGATHAFEFCEVSSFCWARFPLCLLPCTVLSAECGRRFWPGLVELLLLSSLSQARLLLARDYATSYLATSTHPVGNNGSLSTVNKKNADQSKIFMGSFPIPSRLVPPRCAWRGMPSTVLFWRNKLFNFFARIVVKTILSQRQQLENRIEVS